MIKRKPVRALLGMGVSLGLILACVMFVTSALASPAVNMSIVPASHTAVVNETFTVDIELSGPDPVRGASAYINFDKTKLEVQSITPGAALDTVLQNAYDNVAGTIDYSAGKLSGTLPTGTFTLATIHLKALAVTSTPTPLTFVFEEPNRVTDVITTGSVSVLGTVTDGSVTISAAPPTTYTITFATDPTSTGSITFAGVSYSNGGSVNKSAGTYNIVASPGSGYNFSNWQTTGLVSVASATSNTTTCNVTGAGTLKMVQTATAPPPVGGTAYPPNKLLMLAPWIALGAAIIVGTSLLVRRRRSAVK